MNWIDALKSGVSDLTEDNENGLISLLDDPRFVSFVSQAFGKLAPAQRETLVSTAGQALEVLSPRLREASIRFSQKVRPRPFDLCMCGRGRKCNKGGL
jgi:hypothetical protein